ncbi:hypothetical protein ACFW7J_00200 [Streptomyces sp. NPDC059525]|uniref:hypothetical protein n=1 Tax=Streptomyces sp. NPDC059525 TaxID=3346857 RepID=UPI00367EE16D
MRQFMVSSPGEGRIVAREEKVMLTAREVSYLWPGVRPHSVYVNALAYGVRMATDSWPTTTGYAGKVSYNADDVRRVAPQVAAKPLKGPSRVPCCLLLIVLIVGPFVWLAIYIVRGSGWSGW